MPIASRTSSRVASATSLAPALPRRSTSSTYARVGLELGAARAQRGELGVDRVGQPRLQGATAAVADLLGDRAGSPPSHSDDEE